MIFSLFLFIYLKKKIKDFFFFFEKAKKKITAKFWSQGFAAKICHQIPNIEPPINILIKGIFTQILLQPSYVEEILKTISNHILFWEQFPRPKVKVIWKLT